jgi:hypothetical protein
MARQQFYDLVITELTLIKLIKQLDENCKAADSSYDTKSLVEFLADMALGFIDLKMEKVQLEEVLEHFKSERENLKLQQKEI